MGKKRNERDLYETAKEVTQILLDQEEIKGKRVCEPCAGNRMIARVLESYDCLVSASDLVEGEEFDARGELFWGAQDADWVVMNPPFKDAAEIVERALGSNIPQVAALLRLSFLEPVVTRRWLWALYRTHLRKMIVLNPRPRFRTDTTHTDSVTVAWFIWDKNWSWEEQGLSCPFVFAMDWHQDV